MSSSTPAPGADDLLQEAGSVPVEGWDLDRLGERIRVEEPWDHADVVRWLRMVPWAVPGFTVDRFRTRLAALHAAGGPYPVREPRFRLVARRVSG
ncbi:MAG: hypothetical protein ACJ74O_00480 [Frankiaceae bacterium]